MKKLLVLPLVAAALLGAAGCKNDVNDFVPELLVSGFSYGPGMMVNPHELEVYQGASMGSYEKLEIYEGFRFFVNAGGAWTHIEDGTEFTLHEKTQGVVKTTREPGFHIEVQTDFDTVEAGRTKEFEYWCTYGEDSVFATSNRAKVIVHNLEPLILTDSTGKLNIPEVAWNVRGEDGYRANLYLALHPKAGKSLANGGVTNSVVVKQFSRVKGEGTDFTEESVTAAYIDSNDVNDGNYYNIPVGARECGVANVDYTVAPENVGKEIEVYYEFDGVRSNVVTLKAVDAYLKVDMTRTDGTVVSVFGEEETDPIFAGGETISISVKLVEFGQEKEITGYTFSDVYGDYGVPSIKEEAVFSYTSPKSRSPRWKK